MNTERAAKILVKWYFKIKVYPNLKDFKDTTQPLYIPVAPSLVVTYFSEEKLMRWNWDLFRNVEFTVG